MKHLTVIFPQRPLVDNIRSGQEDAGEERGLLLIVKTKIPLGRTSSSDLAGRMQMSFGPGRACLSPLNWLSLKERKVLGCEFTEGFKGR